MNYLKNRYPFNLLTNFFRITTRTPDAIQTIVDPKRNKSDTVLNTASQTSSKESVKLKSKSSVTIAETQNVEKNKLTPTNSNCSLPQSKTSSEHSLSRGYSSFDLSNDDVIHLRRRRNNSSWEREIGQKLQKLQESLSPAREALSNEGRPMLKRSYPWQNFNLDTISQEHLEPKRVARPHSNTSIQSDCSMTSLSNKTLSAKSSNHSLRSFNSASSVSLDSAPKGSLEDIKNQMPLFKSILKKSAYKLETPKEVTFNNISTIYGSRVKKEIVENKEKFCSKKEDDGDVVQGRHEPLREEHSFVRLYYGKNNKTAI